MRQKLKRVFLCLSMAAILLPAAAWADFSMTDPSVSGFGSGESESTATFYNEGPYGVWAPGFGETARLTETEAVTAYQSSTAAAYNGTAEASTSGTIVRSGDGVNDGDSVTVTIAGSTDADAQKESDPSLYPNSAYARLLATGGAGAVESPFFDTATGYMALDFTVTTVSTGSTDLTADTDASSSAKGGAVVEYTFAGQPGPETMNLDNSDISSTADVDQGEASIASARNRANSGGVVGWTDDLTGLALGSFLNLDSESTAVRVGSQAVTGLPTATADAAGTLDVDFVYRPQDEFSFAGDVNGSTDSEAAVTQGNGYAEAQGIKAAVGTAGTQTDLPTGALAFVSGSVEMGGYEANGAELFGGVAEGHAVNPAVLGEADFDPDPSMTVGSQYGAFSASMGSSSLVNAEVTATGEANEYENTDNLMAVAYGFAAAYAENDNNPYLTSAVADGTQPFAIVGQGSLVGADTAPDGTANTTAATANVPNMFGAASSPDFTGTMNNGDSSGSIAQDDDLVFQRLSSASADSVTGTNLYEAIALNQMFHTFDGTTVPPYADIFNGLITNLDHYATGRIIGGGE